MRARSKCVSSTCKFTIWIQLFCLVLHLRSRAQYPSFMEAVVEFRDELIGLEEAVARAYMNHLLARARKVYGKNELVDLRI